MNDVEELLEKHMGIIYYMAKKYRWLDEKDDLVSCGYTGFLLAIQEYEMNPKQDFTHLVFKNIKQVFIKDYFEKNKVAYNYSMSADKPMYGKDGIDGDELITRIINVNFQYSERDIRQMMLDSLSEIKHREMIVDYYLMDKNIEQLCEEYGLNKNKTNRLVRKGKTLIKQYLLNNDYISNWAMNPVEYKFKPPKPIKTLTPVECRQLKYMQSNYSVLNRVDLANILNCDVRTVDFTLNQPTSTYLRYGLDESIKDKAEAYVKKHYPFYLPSEVKTYKLDELIG